MTLKGFSEEHQNSMKLRKRGITDLGRPGKTFLPISAPLIRPYYLNYVQVILPDMRPIQLHHQIHLRCTSLAPRTETSGEERIHLVLFVPATLRHILTGCKTSLSHGRFTWRHNPDEPSHPWKRLQSEAATGSGSRGMTPTGQQSDYQGVKAE